MRSGHLVLLAAVPWITACATASRNDLATSLAAVVAEYRPAEVAIAYRDLATGDTVELHGDIVMHAASTMKVAVMIELFRQADAGEIDLDGSLTVRNSFSSIVDGSPYSLDAGDDSDPGLYEANGRPVPIRELLQRMIARSSNLATNLLVELADPQRVQTTIEQLGTTRMQVRRGVEDILAYRQGRNNTTTAHDLMVLLGAIAEDRAASPASCRQMLQILASQEFNEMIPAGLPPGTRIAHKTGQITGIHHDAAVVFEGDRPAWILVVLTRGFDDPGKSASAVARIAREVHRHRQTR